MAEQTYVELNNGTKIPQFGLGVYMIQGDGQTAKAVKDALDLGYRHIDTAHAYQNERGVGQGIKESGLKREDVWITSKLWPTDYDDPETAIDKMLDRLGTDYIDLLLLHQQVGNYLNAYKGMEKALKEGKVRSIGISNFDGERLDDIIEHSEVKPMVMQVEMHPYYQQKALKEKMKPYGTKFESWYPLGHGDAGLMNESIFTKLAKKYGKTNAQIILRWHIQEENIVFPKTTNPQHMRDNIDIFDFELTDEEMAEINKLDSGKRYYNASLAQQEQFVNYHPAD
ncbi:aldo/keto reductase [Lactobacillus hamsteri]|uniref:2,5-didehydrogluconate reductase n=1 Tax=Lactobacillus hamsteri DSM 5661 = JCM 6256 TaxID=1423754 RepID=A0A0R1YC26_9LACO|nr:aldo/keto reductase [Lactobacillus hamsteri]KRM38500.1 2,5-didehydrogluconate reductase [Lactobacillus hamsteri DSM 5661 = JCM 6256]